MRTERRFARYFGATVLAGVAANAVVAAFGIFNPGYLLDVLELGRAEPDFWLRLTAWLLFLLSLFYIPAALDPYRSRYMSWLTVGCRWGGVVWVSSAVYSLDLDLNFAVFALFDLIFAIPESIFLLLALRSSDHGTRAGPAVATR